MKIAIIHNQFKLSGGMEAYMLALIKGFNACGDEVHVHTFNADSRLTDIYPCILHTSSLSFLPRRFRKYYFIHKYNRTFDRRDYDISLSLTRTSCQDIAVCGGVHPAFTSRVKNFSPLSRIHDRVEGYFEEKMLASVPYIMAHSGKVAQEICHHYRVDERKLHVMYPPINTDIFKPAASEEIVKVQQEYGIGKNRLTLLFPSGGHKRKGLPELLNAFAQLDPEKYELLIAGQKTTRKLPPSVRFIGFVNNLAPLYSAVDFMILPSHYEAFGLVVPESLACGTPVVVAKVAGAAELLSENDGIIIPDNRVETLVKTITGLEKNQFSLTKDFAVKHGLTIDQHIGKIKALVDQGKCRNKP